LIRVAVRNTGNDIARGIHATLSTRDPLVEVTDNYSGWADISPNQTQWPVDRGFQIRIDLANDKTSATLVLLGTYVNASNHRFSFAQELALPINKGFYAKLGSDKAAYTEGESVRLTSTVMATIHHLTNASVTVTLTGPAGLALGPYAMFDDGSHGDDIAGDGEYTYLTVLDQSSPTGSYNATVNATAVLGNYTFTAHDACSLYRYARDESGIWRMRLGKNALVQTTLMRYEDRLTLRKVVEALARQHGLILSPATILDITRRVSFWLEPVYQEIWQKIGQAPVVYVDETGEKVDGVNYWLWTFVTLTETLLVIRKRRSKNVLKEVLGEEFDGWIGCDGWKSYPAFAPNIQRDWAHLFREARELAQEYKYREAEPLYRGLLGIFERTKKGLETDPPPGPEERERLARNARAAMRRWIRRPYRKGKVKSLAKKMDNGFAYWFSYITHPGIEPTNNMAEQSLREPVVQRKIWGCFRNQKGTHIYEVITSVLATWKKREYNTSQMLAQTLTQQWASVLTLTVVGLWRLFGGCRLPLPTRQMGEDPQDRLPETR